MVTNRNGRIRPALPADAEQAAPLIIETGYDTNRIAFGSLDKAHIVLAKMFSKSNNVHSYQLSTVYELENTVAGLLIAYDLEDERKTFWQSAGLIFKHMGFKMGNILRIQGMIGKIDPQDYYIHVLSISPKLRGLGIGAILMKEVENEAIRRNKKRLSLLVEAQNEGAIRFYKREGFKVVDLRQDKRLLKRYGFKGYAKMLKELVSPK